MADFQSFKVREVVTIVAEVLYTYFICWKAAFRTLDQSWKTMDFEIMTMAKSM